MPAADRSNIAATAQAFVTYSLVPYLGIVFSLGAMLVGSFGVITFHRSIRATDEADRGICYGSAVGGLVTLVVQLLLWWILYKVPIWARGF
jgi:hypothetical protein